MRRGYLCAAMKEQATIKRLRILGYLEAFSWVILLIAMYFKYFANQPLMVKYTGWVHGLLFILYCLHLLLAQRILKWSFSKLFLGGLSAFLPFGTLWFDKKITAPTSV